MQHCIGIPYGAHSIHCGTPCIEKISPPWGVKSILEMPGNPSINEVIHIIIILDGHASTEPLIEYWPQQMEFLKQVYLTIPGLKIEYYFELNF